MEEDSRKALGAEIAEFYRGITEKVDKFTPQEAGRGTYSSGTRVKDEMGKNICFNKQAIIEAIEKGFKEMG